MKYLKKYKLFENPDAIHQMDPVYHYLKKVAEWDDDDAYAFGIINGKMYLGAPAETHNEYTLRLRLQKKIETDYDKDVSGGRLRNKYPGRIWIKKKFISFWTYPTSGKEFEEICHMLEQAFKEQYNYDIIIWDDLEFKIEVNESPIASVENSKDDNFYGAWAKYKEENIKLISLKDYKTSYDVPNKIIKQAHTSGNSQVRYLLNKSKRSKLTPDERARMSKNYKRRGSQTNLKWNFAHKYENKQNDKNFNLFLLENINEPIDEYLRRKYSEYYDIVTNLRHGRTNMPLVNNEKISLLRSFLTHEDQIYLYFLDDQSKQLIVRFNEEIINDIVNNLSNVSNDDIIKMLQAYNDLIKPLYKNRNNYEQHKNEFVNIPISKEIVDYVVRTNNIVLFEILLDTLDLSGKSIFTQYIIGDDVFKIVKKYEKTYKILINELGFVDSSTDKIKKNNTLRLILNNSFYYTIYSDGTIRFTDLVTTNMFGNSSLPRIYKKTGINVVTQKDAENLLKTFLDAFINITLRKCSNLIKHIASKDVKQQKKVKPVTLENFKIIINDVIDNLFNDKPLLSISDTEVTNIYNIIKYIPPNVITNNILKYTLSDKNNFALIIKVLNILSHVVSQDNIHQFIGSSNNVYDLINKLLRYMISNDKTKYLNDFISVISNTNYSEYLSTDLIKLINFLI